SAIDAGIERDAPTADEQDEGRPGRRSHRFDCRTRTVQPLEARRPWMAGPTTNPALAYHQYLGPAMFAPMARVSLWSSKMNRGERVLDLACGTGIVTNLLPPLVGPKGKVVGLDVNPSMLEVAKAQPLPEGPPIEWVQANAMATGLPDASFDLVI